MIKLMVVDDEKEVAEFVGNFFSDIGYKVFTVTDPAKVMGIIEKENPHVVLLDIVMPKISGLEILEKIKKTNKGIKVIMISLVDNPQTKEKAFGFGADEYVKKPFTTEYLEDVVMKKINEVLSEIKILVVEDELETLNIIKNNLEKIPHCQVETAEDGDKAVEKIMACEYDLVLLDIKLPGKSGYDVMKEVKKKKQLPDILVVSGYDSSHVIDVFMGEGAVDYLPKPFDVKILQRKIKAILAKKGKRIEISL